MHHIPRQVRKGFQHELAVIHLRMRDPKPGQINDAVFEKKNIEIDGPGHPITLLRPAKFLLYRFEEVEERFRLEMGFDFEDGIEKVGLGELARLEHRLSLIKRRNTSDVSP